MPESAHRSDIESQATASLFDAQPTQDLRGDRPEAAPAPGVQVAGYRIEGILGRGGMGVVYKAVQEKANRLVALKMILAGVHAEPADKTRFRAEAEAAGRLSHPNIVQLYEVGETADGFPFFSLEFVAGGTLADRLKRGPLKAEEAAALIESLARAMQYAHERGIVHRDLKPANILLSGAGREARGEGATDTAKAFSNASLAPGPASLAPVPKISDFGLAKHLDTEDGITRTGAIMGTPSYMAPEQAFGQSKNVGPAADLYALSAILYECLTGRPPFKGATVADTLEQVRTMEPVTLKHFSKEIPADLETICLHCLHKEPLRRYASAEALADDLRRYQERKPISVRPIGTLERSWRWCRRNPGWAMMIALVACSLVGATVVSFGAYLDVSAQRAIAENKRIEAENAQKKAENEEANAKREKLLAELSRLKALKTVNLFATDARMYCEDALVPGESRARLYGVLIKELEKQADASAGAATTDALHDKVLLYQALCSVTLDFRNGAKSKEWFDKGSASLDQWEKIKPGDPVALGFRATLLSLRADGLKQAGNLESAHQFYAKAEQIRRALAGDPDVDLPAKVEAVAKLADSLDSMERFEESIKLRTKICAMFASEENQHARGSLQRKEAQERSFPYREALCSSYEKAGLHASEYDARKKYLAKAASLSSELHEERTSSRNILLHWATSARMLGELEYSHGILAEKNGKPAEAFFAAAANQYEILNTITTKLATSKDLIEPLRDYARSFYTLGLAHKRKGDISQALKHFETSRVIREQTLRDYGRTANSGNLRIDLWFSQLALGDLSMMREAEDQSVIVSAREPEVAYRFACIFALAIATVEESSKGEPLTATEKRNLSRYRHEAFRCLQAAHDRGFTDFFQSNIDADLTAIRADPLMKEFEATHFYQLGVLELKRGDAGAKQARLHFEKSYALAEEGIKTIKGDNREVHVRLGALCARIQLGQHEEAIKEADKIRLKLPVFSGAAAQFRLARVYAVAVGKVTDPKLKEECCAKALNALGKAGEIASEARLIAEDDLEPIRADPRFKKILARSPNQPVR